LLPLISVGLNLLSVGTAYGLITVIFQDGRLRGLLGFTSYGAIAQWVPLFMFVFLVGLSMDYHVFILSRIREWCGRGMSTPDAVTSGIAASAGVVTSAAVIMVAVFSNSPRCRSSMSRPSGSAWPSPSWSMRPWSAGSWYPRR
jgi:putative drug exporter of the RND superfamily